MVAILKKFFLNQFGKISWMKLGGNIVAVALAILTLPAAGVTVPAVIIAAAKIIAAIGGAIGVAGTRDALSKK